MPTARCSRRKVSPRYDPLPIVRSTLTSYPFGVTLPFPTGTASIVLMQGTQQLALRAVPAHAPTVQLTSPSGSQTLNGTVDITWTSADADGHALSYTVLYSADGGDRWVPIAVDLTSKSFAWDTSLAAATTTGEIMVVASDGVNQGSDTATGPFTIAPNLPLVGITSPADGTTVAAGQPLLLQGAGYDVAAGTALLDKDLSWSSSLDGELGTGADLWVSLSAGTNVITLTATDAAGNQTTATTTFTVSSQPGTIQGTVFRDLNGDGTLDPGDPTLAGVTVFIDENGTGTLAAGDPTTQTDANGRYTLSNVAPGTEDVFVVAPSGFFTPGTTAQVPPGGPPPRLTRRSIRCPRPRPRLRQHRRRPRPRLRQHRRRPHPRLRQHRRLLRPRLRQHRRLSPGASPPGWSP